MVLIRTALAGLAIAAAAGCGQSLFDANGPRDGGPGGDGGDGDAAIPETCPADCVGDAAADFNKSPTPWRYLEDAPTRVWLEMNRTGQVLTGQSDARNEIKRCRDNGSAPACRAMPNALLVSSAGDSNTYVPAVEFKASTREVLHLIVRAYIPAGGAEHKIRVFRNSREDVLATETVGADGSFKRQFVVDALVDDRFLVALEPTGQAGGPAALDFFVSRMGESFPSACQLAASFSVANGNGVKDLCAGRDLTFRMGGGGEAAPMLQGVGPFNEQGTAAEIPSGYYFQAPDQPKLQRSGGSITIQFWARVTGLPPSGQNGWLFSDIDLDEGGGLGLGYYGTGPVSKIQLEADTEVGTGTTPGYQEVSFPFDAWKFVRIVDTPGLIKVCVDGAMAMRLDVASDRPESGYPAHLGKSGFQQTPVFGGLLDDVRVLSGALPCD